jgi:tRNA pseudouridine38-40 synthase
MNNIKLVVEYDGTAYHGFQRQPEFHGPTVQGILEDRLSKITESEVKMFMAGRTDKGVHAIGQVVNFLSPTKLPMEKMPKAANSVLPYDIRVKLAEFASEDFNARFSAKSKRYCYTIYNSSIASVFDRLYTFHVPKPLNVDAMAHAASLMVGRRDFTAFCATGTPVKNFVRNLTKCEITQEGAIIRITCEADGFLYNMVRIISGTLVDVGKGRFQSTDIPDILASKQRVRGGATAPAQGLCLMHVEY